MIVRYSLASSMANALFLDMCLDRLINSSGATPDLELGVLKPAGTKISSGVWNISLGARTLRLAASGANLLVSELKPDGVTAFQTTPGSVPFALNCGAGTWVQLHFNSTFFFLTTGTTVSSEVACLLVVPLPIDPQYDSTVSGLALFTYQSLAEVATLAYAANNLPTPVLGTGVFTCATLGSPTAAGLYSKSAAAIGTASCPFVLYNTLGLVDDLNGLLRRVAVTLTFNDLIYVGGTRYYPIYRSAGIIGAVE